MLPFSIRSAIDTFAPSGFEMSFDCFETCWELLEEAIKDESGPIYFDKQRAHCTHHHERCLVYHDEVAQKHNNDDETLVY